MRRAKFPIGNFYPRIGHVPEYLLLRERVQILGWTMGFEPTTTGITIRDSTVELRPPR